MKIGLISDIHRDRDKVFDQVVKKMLLQGVEIFNVCGDIDIDFCKPELFGYKKVFCALTDEDDKKAEFKTPPSENWIYTRPGLEEGRRIFKVCEGLRAYMGHKLSRNLIQKPIEEVVIIKMDEVNAKADKVDIITAGHTHHQIYCDRFINPGAIETPIGIGSGGEYAIYDSETREVVFSRVLLDQDQRKPFRVAVISDSLDVTKKTNGTFWVKLVQRLKDLHVEYLIIVGNIHIDDVGKIPGLEEIKEIHYHLRHDQINPAKLPENWRLIKPDKPIIDINGFRFYTDYDLGASILSKSEITLGTYAADVVKRHTATRFVLFGLTYISMYFEEEFLNFISPGNVVNDRNYVIIELPLQEITFGRIPKGH